jgi:hypothetical protein
MDRSNHDFPILKRYQRFVSCDRPSGVEVGGTAIAILTQHLYPIALGLPAVSLKTVSDKSMVAEAVSGA